MEAAFYFVDVGITVLCFYWMVKMAKRKPGEATSGLFAYFDVIPPKRSIAQRMIDARRTDAPGRNPPPR
jgi:hypothetical protein